MHSKIVGPFWQAEVTVVELADPLENLALRALFVENRTTDGTIQRQSTTLLLLADVDKVRVKRLRQGTQPYTFTRPPGPPSPQPASYQELEALLRSGELALLLVEADDAQQPAGDTRQYTCLSGEISLDRLHPQSNARQRLYQDLRLEEADPDPRSGAAALSATLAVHGSGLSIYGRASLPWQDELVAAPFQLTRLRPQPGTLLPDLDAHLSVERERLTSEEQGALVRAWRLLGTYVNPGSQQLDDPDLRPSAPHWVTLELTNPTDVPHLFWEWDRSALREPVLQFRGDQLRLLLSDQQPYNQTCPPTSLARVALDRITLEQQGEELHLEVLARAALDAAEEEPGPQPATMRYSYEDQEVAPEESLEVSGAHLAFDPLQTPQLLRNYQELPEPEWLGGTPEEPDVAEVEPEVVWAFSPLADGWAQLPVPNLTEQIYLDAELEQFDQPPADPPGALLEGAVAFGNDDLRFVGGHPQEQPWNITLTAAHQATGHWVLLAPEAENGFKLTRVSLELVAPRLVVNGLLWFSTGRPTAADALPDLEDWTTGLASLSLRTVDPRRDLFPPLVKMSLPNGDEAGPDPADPLRLYVRSEGEGGVSAELQSWALSFQVDDELLQEMAGKKVLGDDTFSRNRPWLWRRHPTLPMVQALPLTQSQSPPNHPSASRQLVPFRAPAVSDLVLGVPGGATSAAASWPLLLSQVAPDDDWASLADLPLVALSLPGLVLDPSLPEPGLGTDEATGGAEIPGPLAATHLPLQYRFDLPYTDEVNALAQVPEIVPDPEMSSPLPDSPPPEPPPPLSPKTFAGHWAGLSERASLAAADAVEAIADENGQTLVRHLVEPYDWPVTADLHLAAYPGSLTLEGGAGESQVLSGERALRGISGRFVAESASGQLATSAVDDENPFLLEAGSMAAHRLEDGAYRDQRGLSRGASSLVADNGLVQTPVHLQAKDPAETVAYRLTSLILPLEMALNDQDEDRWQLWFRDLPVGVEDGTFGRGIVLSEQAQDINDPGALSRERDYLAGYEWRLGEVGAASPDGQVSALPLFGLHFYPLTLEEVTLGDGGVRGVELVGRLQLPLGEPSEMADLSNAVRLTFEYDDAEGHLELTAIALVSDVVEWPLALEQGEDGGVPRLVWDQVELSEGELRAGGVRLRFFLSGVEWTHLLGTLAFPLTEGLLRYDDLPAGDGLGIYAESLELSLDPTGTEHDLALVLGLDLGKQVEGDLSSRFRTKVRYDLLGTGAGTASLRQAKLFGDLGLSGDEPFTIALGAGAIQFDFQLAPETEGLQLLPGMRLEPGGSAPGFAAVTFTATESPGSIPDLRLASAFVEVLLSCRWAEGLQDRVSEEPQAHVTPDQVFASSAGSLVFGYTTQLRAGQWEESLLLNGVLEVKNLISWPAEWTRPGATPEAELVLPLVPANGQLHHSRHTIRVLFNQHQVPGENLVTSLDRDDLLFNLRADRPWQFLAVVEHQLVDIEPQPVDLELQPEDQSLTASRDRRWTTLQEVRLLRPHRFGTFLADHADPCTTAPIPDNGGFPTSLDYGYWGDTVRNEMTQVLNRLPDTMLLVEASAPHWIHIQPLNGVQTTTLQFLPNGSQHGALSRPDDYLPSDPADPEWLLLPMPFLGRLQAAADDVFSGGGGGSALQADPILLLQQQGAAAPSLAWLLSHWRKEASAPDKMLVSSFDTALGRTWARLDPTSLQENWFRLQNPVPEPQATVTQSIMAALPDTPARLSRATALRRAFDAFRPFYPPATPDPLELLAVGSTSDIVWRRDSLMALQGIREIESQGTPGEDEIANGAFDPDPSTNHPLEGHPVVGWQVGDDQVPHDWEAYEFAYQEWHYQGSSSSGWTKTKVPLDPQLPKPAGRRDWGLLRMRAPNPEEVKPAGPLNQGTSWLLYSDGLTPLWAKVGQSVQLTPGRYRFSLSVYPAQESSEVPATDPTDSQVVLFAGTQRTRILDGSDLPFDRWSRAQIEFEVSDTTTLRLGVELHGPGRFLRNGWYLNDAELVPLTEQREGWHVTATQLRGIAGHGEAAPQGTQSHAAATLLPAQLAIDGTDNPRPLSFAVSPYLRLEFRPAAGDAILRMVSVELLCLDSSSVSLRPVASKYWEAQEGALAADEIQNWARETHRRLSPESPIAVLRHRQINESGSDEGGQSAVLTTTYRFAILPNLIAPAMARRAFRLRTEPRSLRFREGQFGGQEMPQNVLPFEVAPPQTVGVQPLYLTQRPASSRPGTWPWGLSALRLSVQYSRDKVGAIGAVAEPGDGPDNGSGLTLWWQAPQHLVQFRAPGANRPTWTLPTLYRARAIKSLLPVLSTLPLPSLDFSEDGHQSWQPLLPGALRYLISGARAGVMLAIRNQLLRQSSLEAGQANQVGKGLVSGSVPAQHRMPRPVPLPPNHGVDKALQPWASYFEPGQNLLATPSPADEAFIAECGGHPARRLRMKLVEPERGALTADWNGKLLFENDVDLVGDPRVLPVETDVQLEITDGLQTFTLTGENGEDRFALDAQDLKQLLEGKVGGQVLTANAHVSILFRLAHEEDPAFGFSQTLSFPLRFVDASQPRLPLVPSFLHFEDPEYNRRLSSQAATAAANVREAVDGEDLLHTVTLATDRREYNPDSRLALRYDWDDGGTKVTRTASLSLKRIDQDGIEHVLTLDDGLSALRPARLVQMALSDLRQDGEQVAWQPDETLQLKLELTFPGSADSDDNEIVLDVRVVQEPVIPAPEAAYALLRWQHDGTQVECVRFAWQPNASRVELVCPDDLQTEVVRRRAVFHWTDSARAGTVNGYAVQKITLTGSTHFPQKEPIEEI
jgi:hypothetical protein